MDRLIVKHDESLLKEMVLKILLKCFFRESYFWKSRLQLKFQDSYMIKLYKLFWSILFLNFYTGEQYIWWAGKILKILQTGFPGLTKTKEKTLWADQGEVNLCFSLDK